ncbi:AMP-binding protein [Nostoc sp. NIES-2111]
MSLEADFRCLAARWEKVVQLHGTRPCLSIRQETRTYNEIDAMARRWAGALLMELGRPAERVGVFGSRSFISYTGILASLLSGAAFVPLNPRFPLEKTRRMIELANLDAIFVDKLAEQQLAGLLEGLTPLPRIYRPEELERISQDALSSMRIPLRQAHDLAYLLFTSGSTGQPKGVPITQGNLRAYLDWAHTRYQFTPEDRFSQTFDQTFDLSVHDQFLCWESGACLYSLTPPELLAPARFIQRNELSVWFSVPSVVAQMRKRGTLATAAFPSLRWSLFCGEPLPQASSEAWQAAAPNSIVENLYGPTELTIACTVHRWDSELSPALCRNGITPIGKPFPGLAMKLLGEEQELAVSGPQTSPGYWNDAVRTATAFLSLPEGRFYRTGDRVAILPNGELACLGRIDHQVKVLGFRVELGEIEAALRRNPRVLEAVALGWPVVDGSAQGIVAFVQGQDIDVEQLRREARALLSDYMVPEVIHLIEDFPLNANGKIDRAALAQRLSGTHAT